MFLGCPLGLVMGLKSSYKFIGFFYGTATVEGLGLQEVHKIWNGLYRALI